MILACRKAPEAHREKTIQEVKIADKKLMAEIKFTDEMIQMMNLYRIPDDDEEITPDILKRLGTNDQIQHIFFHMDCLEYLKNLVLALQGIDIKTTNIDAYTKYKHNILLERMMDCALAVRYQFPLQGGSVMTKLMNNPMLQPLFFWQCGAFNMCSRFISYRNFWTYLSLMFHNEKDEKVQTLAFLMAALYAQFGWYFSFLVGAKHVDANINASMLNHKHLKRMLKTLHMFAEKIGVIFEKSTVEDFYKQCDELSTKKHQDFYEFRGLLLKIYDGFAQKVTTKLMTIYDQINYQALEKYLYVIHNNTGVFLRILQMVLHNYFSINENKTVFHKLQAAFIQEFASTCTDHGSKKGSKGYEVNEKYMNGLKQMKNIKYLKTESYEILPGVKCKIYVYDLFGKIIKTTINIYHLLDGTYDDDQMINDICGELKKILTNPTSLPKKSDKNVKKVSAKL